MKELGDNRKTSKPDEIDGEVPGQPARTVLFTWHVQPCREHTVSE